MYHRAPFLLVSYHIISFLTLWCLHSRVTNPNLSVSSPTLLPYAHNLYIYFLTPCVSHPELCVLPPPWSYICICPTPVCDQLRIYSHSMFILISNVQLRSLRVFISLCVYPTPCVSNSVCLPFRLVSHSVSLLLDYPTPSLSNSLIIQPLNYPTPCRESPTSIYLAHSVCIPLCISHPVYLTLYIPHCMIYSTLCVPLCGVPLFVSSHIPLLRLYLTLCVSRSLWLSPCETKFVRVAVLCIPLPYPTPYATPCVSPLRVNILISPRMLLTRYASHFLWTSFLYTPLLVCFTSHSMCFTPLCALTFGCQPRVWAKNSTS